MKMGPFLPWQRVYAFTRISCTGILEIQIPTTGLIVGILQFGLVESHGKWYNLGEIIDRREPQI
jgi:hypothetical protein